MERDREELVLMLLREGSRSQAIRLYQEETGASPEEAREAIGSLADSYGLGRRWLTMLLVLLLVLAIGGVVAAMAGQQWRAGGATALDGPRR
jgi:hypothetical protein